MIYVGYYCTNVKTNTNAKEYLTNDVEDACYTFDKDEYIRDKYRV